jgi:hypothetical protein
VKVFVLFLLVSFVLGGRSAGRENPDRVWRLLGVCMLVSAALYSYRLA